MVAFALGNDQHQPPILSSGANTNRHRARSARVGAFSPFRPAYCAPDTLVIVASICRCAATPGINKPRAYLAHSQTVKAFKHSQPVFFLGPQPCFAALRCRRTVPLHAASSSRAILRFVPTPDTPFGNRYSRMRVLRRKLDNSLTVIRGAAISTCGVCSSASGFLASIRTTSRGGVGSGES